MEISNHKFSLLYLADPYAHMSNAVGVGSHTLTADGHLVLMKRACARACAEWAGATDRPGGHAEPDLAMAQQVRTMSKLAPVARESLDAGPHNLALSNEIVTLHCL